MSIRFALHMICAFMIGAIPNAVWGLNFWNWQWWAIVTPSLIILNMFFKLPKK